MLDQLERKIGWITFPSVIRYLAFFQLGVLGLTLVNPQAASLLTFNWGEILAGQYWRIFSFIFVPAGNLNGINALFAVCGALLMMSFSDGLEARLGSFRTSLFFYTRWLTCILASVLFSVIPGGILHPDPLLTIPSILSPGLLFDAAILLAFATYYPSFELRLFFFLPVPIAVIAGITGLLLVGSILLGPLFFVFTLCCLSNYLVMAIPMLFKLGKRKSHQIKHTARKQSPPALHTCAVCGATDVSHPERSFRISASGTERCCHCRAQQND